MQLLRIYRDFGYSSDQDQHNAVSEDFIKNNRRQQKYLKEKKYTDESNRKREKQTQESCRRKAGGHSRLEHREPMN